MTKKIIGGIVATIFFLGGSGVVSASDWAYQYNIGSCPSRSELFPDPNGKENCINDRTAFLSAHPSYTTDSLCMVSFGTKAEFDAAQSSNSACHVSVAPNAPANQNSAPNAGLSVSVPLANPIRADTFSAFVSQVIKSAVEILMPFVVLAFIWSGFLFVRAQGKDAELTEAKKAIWWSIIGAFILMGAWGFAQIVCTTVANISGDVSSSCQ